MTERVLVLGATGCIGRHVCAAFRERGAEVVAAARHHVADAPADRFVPIDLTTCSSSDLAEVLAVERITAIVNAVLGWGRDDEEMAKLNVRPVEVTLEALRHLPVPPRLVQLGTVHEYGPMVPGTAVDEGAETQPETLYARAKLATSRLVIDAAKAGLADAVVLRLTNTIGPRPALGSFFGSLAVRLRDADPDTSLEIQVAEAHRDYIDVRDAAAAIVTAARSGAGDPLINIGSGSAYSLRQLVNELVAVSGRPPGAVRQVAVNGSVSGQSGGTPSEWVLLDNRRARQLLGWRPRHGIAQSLRDMYFSVAGVQA